MIAYYSEGHPQQSIPIDQAVRQHYDSLSATYGYEVHPTESYLNAYVWGLLSFQQQSRGLALAQLNQSYYPGSAAANRSLGNMLLQTGDTLAAKAALETAYAISPDEDLRTTLDGL